MNHKTVCRTAPATPGLLIKTNIYLKKVYKDLVNFTEGNTFKCKLCNKLLARNKDVLHHTISVQKATQKIMKKNFQHESLYERKTLALSKSTISNII